MYMSQDILCCVCKREKINEQDLLAEKSSKRHLALYQSNVFVHGLLAIFSEPVRPILDLPDQSGAKRISTGDFLTYFPGSMDGDDECPPVAAVAHHST